MLAARIRSKCPPREFLLMTMFKSSSENDLILLKILFRILRGNVIGSTSKHQLPWIGKAHPKYVPQNFGHDS